MPKKLTAEEFIVKARAMHGAGTYDYSKTVYLPNPQKLTIICPAHGEFLQRAGQHLSGKGCKKCAVKDNGLKHRKSAARQIARFQAVHGVGTYDYSRLPESFIMKGELLTIICPAHGEFLQEGYVHNRSGCPVCSNKLRGENRRLSLPEFIAKAEAAHGPGTYDYSRAVYQGNDVKLTIICPAHGEFEQVPAAHFRPTAPTGCPSCAEERKRRGWIEAAKGKMCTLYFIRLWRDGEEFFKVGITANSIKVRYSARARDLAGYSYEVLALHKSSNAAAVYDWEQSILATFAQLSYRPKVYIPGASECFSSCEEILEIFPA